MSSAKEYRENANECFGWARTAKTDRERDNLKQRSASRIVFPVMGCLALWWLLSGAVCSARPGTSRLHSSGYLGGNRPGLDPKNDTVARSSSTQASYGPALGLSPREGALGALGG